MELNFLKKYTRNRDLRYLFAGIVNTLFGYFLGVFLYIYMIDYVNIIFISVLSNLIAITFSFLVYKVYVFRTQENWLKEYFKCFIVYGGSILFGIFMMWLLVDRFSINIWVAQFLTIAITVAGSYFGHRSFTFKVKK